MHKALPLGEDVDWKPVERPAGTPLWGSVKVVDG